MIFANLHKIWNLNKREEGTVESLTVGPACQRHRVLPESFRVDRGTWFKGWSNEKRSPSAMVARQSYPGLRRPSPTSRASGKGGLSISETTRSW